MSSQVKLSIENFKDISKAPVVIDGDFTGTLYAYLPDELRLFIGNTSSSIGHVSADDIRSVVKSSSSASAIELPTGIYTKNSFDTQLVKSLLNKDVYLSNSYMVGVNLDIPIHISGSYVIDSSFFGGSLLHSHGLNSKSRGVVINDMLVYKTRFPTGASLNSCNIIKSSTTNVEFGDGTVVQGGVHSFAACLNGVYVGKSKTKTNTNLPISVLNKVDNNKHGHASFKLSPKSAYIPKYAPGDVVMNCSILGRTIPVELLGKKNRVEVEHHPFRDAFVADLINTAIKRNRFSDIGVEVSKLYRHLNAKVDVSLTDITTVSAPLPGFDVRQGLMFEEEEGVEVEKKGLASKPLVSDRRFSLALDYVIQKHSQQMDLFGGDLEIKDKKLEEVIDLIGLDKELSEKFNQRLNSKGCPSLELWCND